MFQWDQVRYFVAVARCGSVSRAAVDLGVSHATVLRQVARLEHSLATRLFEHRQTGYRITREGQELLRLAEEMAANADALLRRAAGKDSALAGDLRLRLPDASICDLLPLLKGFGDTHPGIRPLLSDPASADVDIDLRMTDAPPEDLVGRQLAKLSFTFQGTAKASKAKRPRWIVWRDAAEPEATLAWQAEALAAITREPDIALEVASHAEAVAAARAGFGMALLAAAWSPDLAPLPDAPTIPARSLWLLTHPDLRRSGRVRAFMAYAAAYFLPASVADP
ncbi:MAG: LysR family transcriptional regulator [Gammaproteobacteria bacterium]|nr:MAG: LysR family transcriptional regulator [Gammaproteobacteria bacterium]